MPWAHDKLVMPLFMCLESYLFIFIYVLLCMHTSRISYAFLLGKEWMGGRSVNIPSVFILSDQ